MKTSFLGAAFALLLFFSGCNAMQTTSSDVASESLPAETTSESSSEVSSAPASSEPSSSSDPESSSPDDAVAAITPVEELPQPYTGQVAAARGDVVFSRSQASNTATLDAFVASVNSKLPAQVRITLWDDANGPFFRDLVYDGSKLTAYYDDTGETGGERKTSVSEFTGVRLEETHDETYNATFIDFYLTGGADSQDRKVCSYTKQAVSLPATPPASSSSSQAASSQASSSQAASSQPAPSKPDAQSSSSAPTSSRADQSGSVAMTTSQNAYEPDIQKIKITVNNSSDRRIVYGEEFALERRQSGEWQTVTPAHEQLFNDIAFLVDAGGASDYLMGLTDYDSPLETGRYRVSKPYFYEDDSSRKQPYTVYADFEIVATTDSLRLESPLEVAVKLSGSTTFTTLTRQQKYEGRSPVTYISALLTKFKPLPADWEMGSAGGSAGMTLRLLYTDGSSAELLVDPTSSHITDGGRWEPLTVVTYDRQRYYADAEVYSLLQKCVETSIKDAASSSSK